MDPNQPQYSAAPQYASPAAPSAYPAATPAAPAATPATSGGKKMSISLMSLVVGAAAFLSFLLSFGSFEDIGGSRFAVIDNPSFWSQAFTAFQALAMLLLAAVAAVSLFWPADKEILGFRRSHLEVGLALYLTVTLFSYVVTGALSAGWALVIDLLLSIIALVAAVLGHLGVVKVAISMPSPKPAAPINPYQGGYAPGVSGGGYAQPGYPPAAQPGAYGTPSAAPGATYGTPAATPSYPAPSYGQPAAQPAYGQPAYGQPAYGQPAAQPAAQPPAQPGYPQAAQPAYGTPSYPQPGGYPQASPYSAAPTSAQPASAQPASAQPASAQPESAQPYSGQPYSGQPYSAQPAGGQPYGGQPANPAPNTSIAPPPAPETMRIPAPPEPGAQPQASYPQQPPQSGDSLI